MRIQKHPILDIPAEDWVEFRYEGIIVRGQRGKTIAAALHQAGFPVHSHSMQGRQRSLACGIGKCGACEMWVDGRRRRICTTLVDGVREVRQIDALQMPLPGTNTSKLIYKTTVAIIGAGPAGLACRAQLNKWGIDNLVIDANAKVGGQFNMQTHQFFFFEQEQLYGGMRGFDIAAKLVGDNDDGILLHTTVWDLLEGRRIAIKDLLTDEVGYVDAEHLVVATGAIPFVPTFENDDLPGVFTAAVFQKMMNQELTLLGRNVLTVGAGNIGYLTSYQAVQAGAKIHAIIEAMDHEGGFPVQANRVRRLGIPILTGYMLLKALPNADHTGVVGAVVAECKNFLPIAGTERVIEGIDMINICTGLIPDDKLLVKGKHVFGFNCYGAGDAVRIGEGTSAVLRGRQVAYEVAQNMGMRVNYDDYLQVSRSYLESQQRPVRLLDQPRLPSAERQQRPFVQMDCLYGFACNPCTFSCDQQAISKPTTSSVPVVDYDKCLGCMKCVSHCPGLAIFGYNTRQKTVFLPVEYQVEEGSDVDLVDNRGQVIAHGRLEHLTRNANKTNVARIRVDSTSVPLTDIKGFLLRQTLEREECPISDARLPESAEEGRTFVCHCEDVDVETILAVVGERKYISIDELKHVTRLGMGHCRGNRCIPRVRQLLRAHGVELTGDATPRAPLANQVLLGEIYTEGVSPQNVYVAHSDIERREVEILVAGGGMAGSAAFRYFAEAGRQVTLINYDRGSTWRCIGGGRPAFSNPDISDIARHNLEIFREVQRLRDINLKMTRYVNLVHDEATYQALDASRAWSDAYMIDRKDFATEISPRWNTAPGVYSHALITRECWQATPGRTVEVVRGIGVEHGGVVLEDTELVEVHHDGDGFLALVRTHDKKYVEYRCRHFVNALGWNAEKFTDMLGIDTTLYPVKHQAFITSPLPMLGKGGDSLDMIIDRRHYKGFSAVYGQQFLHTGQIIGCASPDQDAAEAKQSLKYNSREFLEVCSDVFCQWIPELRGVSLRAVWAGYYMEPRYIVDPSVGLLTGLRGHGFMLGQYLARLYVDAYLGRPTPSYMTDLSLHGKGLSENAFK